MDEKPNVTRCHCNECGHQTNHLVIAERRHSGSENVDDAGGFIDWDTHWEMLECRGCESVCLRKSFTFSEADWTEVTMFPPATSREQPVWVGDLPAEVRDILKETYAALNADSRRLATMGARTLIDIVMLEKIGDIGGFEVKLKGLVAQGVLSTQNRDFLEAALEAGNAAAHRGHAPRSSEVSHVMDIVENLLQAVYVLPKATSVLKARTPPRPPRPSKVPVAPPTAGPSLPADSAQ